MNAVLEKVKPLVTNDFEAPGLRFSASCFGGINWSLARLQTNNDVYQHQEFADQLRSAITSAGARMAFAPTPTAFNGKVGLPRELTNTISLGNGVYVRRNNKALMDGTFLSHKHEAGIFSAGGCGVIVATYRHLLVFAHAGRDCLLDRLWVKTEGAERTPDRAHISVVDSIIEALGVTPEKMHEVHVWPLYFIRPEEFSHRANDIQKDHGEYNRAAIRFLPTQYGKECGDVTSDRIMMDLPRIARKQCLGHGIPCSNIHMEHCYLDNELPHTRKGEGTTRYLVAIVRNS